MTVREKLESMLVSNGMFESQAKEVMEMAMPLLNNEMGVDEGQPIYKLTYDRPAKEYPDFLYPILFDRLKPIALQWIDKNKPAAWFREMFVTNEATIPAVEEKKPAKLSEKMKVVLGVATMGAVLLGIGLILNARPKREIRKYMCNPRIKKPRNARRRLRRRAQRLNPLSCRYRGIKL